MSEQLLKLLEAAKGTSMSTQECEEQRVSFAYGNTHFENECITREMVTKESESLKQDGCS
jgi:hypothetical protein